MNREASPFIRNEDKKQHLALPETEYEKHRPLDG